MQTKYFFTSSHRDLDLFTYSMVYTLSSEDNFIAQETWAIWALSYVSFTVQVLTEWQCDLGRIWWKNIWFHIKISDLIATFGLFIRSEQFENSRG